MKSLRVKDFLLVDNGMTGQVFGTTSSYDADGAIALTDSVVLLDGSSEALAMTLAAGTSGQRIILKCIDASNNCVVTPAAFFDGTTLTFDAANEAAELVSDGTNWYVVSNSSTLA